MQQAADQHRPFRRALAGITGLAGSLVAAAALLAVPGIFATSHASGAAGPAPQFTLEQRGGGSVSLADLKGKVVLVNFWATWCGPCRKEMPLLEQIHRKYAPLGLVMVGVNVEEDGRLFDTFLKDVPVSFPILLDPKNGVSKLYDVAAMPSTVIIDRKGNIRYVHQGYQPGDENAYQDMVRTLIRERT
ncbi:MAG: TlpA family protein disulfide reductase [Chromatiales bacterium]|jgi:thiol-disulfide isomerase/thioredoxin|nr:TlpA family protein disulfide reductase [Chromatiales bacterium]